MQTLQYLNSDPTSYIHTTRNINNLFVKTDDVSVVSWLQEITSVISDVILHNNLFHHATLCIPRTHLSTSLRDLCLDIISHSLPTSWKIYMYYLTQPILENAYMHIGIPFTSIRNMTKRAYPLTNPPTFTLPLILPWMIFNALMSPSHTILTARDYSSMKFHSIPRYARITTLAYLTSLLFYTLHLLQS